VKKKKKKEDEDIVSSYTGMVSNWWNGLDTSQYKETANSYLNDAQSTMAAYMPASAPIPPPPKAAAAPTPKAVAAPPPTRIAPPPVEPTEGKKSFFSGLFGVGKQGASVEPVVEEEVVPITRDIPSRRVKGKLSPSFTKVMQSQGGDEGEGGHAIVLLGERVAPKPEGPVARSAEELRKAMVSVRIGGFDDEPLVKRRDEIVNRQTGPYLMTFDQNRIGSTRRHPQVAPRRSSDGDEPVGEDQNEYLNALTDAACLEDPMDFVGRTGIDRVVHSRQFVNAMKRSLSEARTVLPQATSFGEHVFVGDRPLSPTQEHISTIPFFPPRSKVCSRCGFFDYACVCHVTRGAKVETGSFSPIEAYEHKQEIQKQHNRISCRKNTDSPPNSQDEGEPAQFAIVNTAPKLKFRS